MQTLSTFLRHHALRRPDAIAIIYGETRISYSELHERVLRLASWLQRRGVAEGDVVALVMKNSPAFVELAFAVSHLGAVLLPVNYRLVAREVAYIVRHAQGKLVFVDEELLAALGARGLLTYQLG